MYSHISKRRVTFRWLPQRSVSCHDCTHHLLTSSGTWSQSGKYCGNYVACIPVHTATSSYATNKAVRTASFYNRIVAASNARVRKLENCPKVRNGRVNMFMRYISARYERRMLLICCDGSRTVQEPAQGGSINAVESVVDFPSATMRWAWVRGRGGCRYMCSPSCGSGWLLLLWW